MRAAIRCASSICNRIWSFQGCNQSQLSYRFDDSDVAGTFAERSGVIPLQRLGVCAAP
jgi:hypothetical protein